MHCILLGATIHHMRIPTWSRPQLHLHFFGHKLDDSQLHVGYLGCLVISVFLPACPEAVLATSSPNAAVLRD